MYSYNYNIPQMNRNMYRGRNYQDQRFVGGGFLAPLLLGGVAGYAIGYNRPNYYQPPMMYYQQPYPTYYSNNYYYPYGY